MLDWLVDIGGYGYHHQERYRYGYLRNVLAWKSTSMFEGHLANLNRYKGGHWEIYNYASKLRKLNLRIIYIQLSMNYFELSHRNRIAQMTCTLVNYLTMQVNCVKHLHRIHIASISNQIVSYRIESTMQLLYALEHRTTTQMNYIDEIVELFQCPRMNRRVKKNIV